MAKFLKTTFLLLVVISILQVPVSAQRRSSDDAPVTFEELYDAPYDINQLFIGFQPMYGETFVSNLNGGFGLDVTYFHQDLLRIHANGRMTYGKKFDLERDRAERNSTYLANYYTADEAFLINGSSSDTYRRGMTDRIASYVYFEVGGTYHIKDNEKDSETKMYLYKKSYLGDKWSSRVPKVAPIPCKVRNIIGARLGAMYYQTSTDLNRAMKKQGVGLDELIATDGSLAGTPFSDTYGTDNVSLAANMKVLGIFLGGSYTWIHNVAVEFDNKYEPGVDDLILTAYLDFIYGASVIKDDITYRDENSTPNPTTYSLDAVNVNRAGFRLGLEGKFNRTLSWSYGGEMGYKPSLKGRGFFALIKISVPVYSTNLKYEVEAFGK